MTGWAGRSRTSTFLTDLRVARAGRFDPPRPHPGVLRTLARMFPDGSLDADFVAQPWRRRRLRSFRTSRWATRATWARDPAAGRRVAGGGNAVLVGRGVEPSAWGWGCTRLTTAASRSPASATRARVAGDSARQLARGGRPRWVRRGRGRRRRRANRRGRGGRPCRTPGGVGGALRRQRRAGPDVRPQSLGVRQGGGRHRGHRRGGRADGKVTVAASPPATGGPPENRNGYAVLRLNPDGSRDRTFGGRGRAGRAAPALPRPPTRGPTRLPATFATRRRRPSSPPTRRAACSCWRRRTRPCVARRPKPRL